jgi:hypothetical protein
MGCIGELIISCGDGAVDLEVAGRLSPLAAELASLNPDVIFSFGGPPDPIDASVLSIFPMRLALP